MLPPDESSSSLTVWFLGLNLSFTPPRRDTEMNNTNTTIRCNKLQTTSGVVFLSREDSLCDIVLDVRCFFMYMKQSLLVMQDGFHRNLTTKSDLI